MRLPVAVWSWTPTALRPSSSNGISFARVSSFADLPGIGPHVVSAQIDGNSIIFTQTVTQTPTGAVTDRTRNAFRLVN
jgi:hypothetical protein